MLRWVRRKQPPTNWAHAFLTREKRHKVQRGSSGCVLFLSNWISNDESKTAIATEEYVYMVSKDVKIEVVKILRSYNATGEVEKATRLGGGCRLTLIASEPTACGGIGTSGEGGPFSRQCAPSRPKSTSTLSAKT